MDLQGNKIPKVYADESLHTPHKNHRLYQKSFRFRLQHKFQNAKVDWKDCFSVAKIIPQVAFTMEIDFGSWMDYPGFFLVIQMRSIVSS